VTKPLSLLLMGTTAACSGQAAEQDGASNAPKPLVEAPPVMGFAQTLGETAPSDNLLTEARAQLGRRLFYDPQLSRDGTVACASCHRQEFGFADPAPVSLGVDGRQGTRNAPQLANLAWVRTGLFWDGRVATLEQQASRPIADPLEMDLEHSQAVERLATDASYQAAFAEAYSASVSLDLLEKALASFVRTLVSANSPYDKYMLGDQGALSKAAKRGLELFLGQAECFHCHAERTLTNDGFFNNGTYLEGGDVGRQAITGRTGDLGKFRVPTLRNIAVTAPYMHDGSIPTLEGVIDHYAQGGSGHPSTDAQIEPLDLSADDKADLLAFLEALTDEAFLADARFAEQAGN
jgi:cytochrome c peroxidase